MLFCKKIVQIYFKFMSINLKNYVFNFSNKFKLSLKNKTFLF